MNVPTTQCVRAAELRKVGSDNIEAWLLRPNCKYIGRGGRVFITVNGASKVYHYPGSIWANPYVISKNGQSMIVLRNGVENIRASKYSLADSLVRYEAHIRSTLWARLGELSGCVLGCFCAQGPEEKCHAQVLVRLWRESQI